MKKITVYDDAAVVVTEKLQELAKRLYEDLTELRENYIIEEDSDHNSDNNFAYLSGALEEFIDSKVEVGE
jgi:hypothetical protein